MPPKRIRVETPDNYHRKTDIDKILKSLDNLTKRIGREPPCFSRQFFADVHLIAKKARELEESNEMFENMGVIPVKPDLDIEATDDESKAPKPKTVESEKEEE